MTDKKTQTEIRKELLQARHRAEEAQARNRVKERNARTRRLIQEGAVLEASSRNSRQWSRRRSDRNC